MFLTMRFLSVPGDRTFLARLNVYKTCHWSSPFLRFILPLKDVVSSYAMNLQCRGMTHGWTNSLIVEIILLLEIINFNVQTPRRERRSLVLVVNKQVGPSQPLDGQAGCSRTTGGVTGSQLQLLSKHFGLLGKSSVPSTVRFHTALILSLRIVATSLIPQCLYESSMETLGERVSLDRSFE